MPKFYGTFMQKQATKNHYVEIEADSVGLARDAMFNHFGTAWMTVYTTEQFEGQTELFGLKKLIGIQVISHGHGSIEYREHVMIDTIKNGLLNPEMSTQSLRLHMGEITASEVRVARAAIAWANSVACISGYGIGTQPGEVGAGYSFPTLKKAKDLIETTKDDKAYICPVTVREVVSGLAALPNPDTELLAALKLELYRALAQSSTLLMAEHITSAIVMMNEAIAKHSGRG